jgi:hypothetical protein
MYFNKIVLMFSTLLGASYIQACHFSMPEMSIKKGQVALCPLCDKKHTAGSLDQHVRDCLIYIISSEGESASTYKKAADHALSKPKLQRHVQSSSSSSIEPQSASDNGVTSMEIDVSSGADNSDPVSMIMHFAQTPRKFASSPSGNDKNVQRSLLLFDTLLVATNSLQSSQSSSSSSSSSSQPLALSGNKHHKKPRNDASVSFSSSSVPALAPAPVSPAPQVVAVPRSPAAADDDIEMEEFETFSDAVPCIEFETLSDATSFDMSQVPANRIYACPLCLKKSGLKKLLEKHIQEEHVLA